MRRALHPHAETAVLWVQAFDTVEELRLALLVFYARHNRDWLIESNGQQTFAIRR